MVFSPNGKYLASGSYDCTVGLWRLSNGERIKSLSGNFLDVKSVVFSQNGEYLVFGSWDCCVGVWRV